MLRMAGHALQVLTGLALICLLGWKAFSRSSDLDQVQSVTGVPFPPGSDVLDHQNQFYFQSDHTQVTVRVPEAERAPLLKAHPEWKRACAEPADGGAAPGACFSDVRMGDGSSTHWSVEFWPDTGLLVEQVDGFW